jgi:hypothetical protein
MGGAGGVLRGGPLAAFGRPPGVPGERPRGAALGSGRGRQCSPGTSSPSCGSPPPC